MSEINVTPFVDILLVLLIAFVISAPFLTQALPIRLPKGHLDYRLPDYETSLLVVVDPSLTIRMDERNHTLDSLRQTLQRADKSLRLRPVYLQIDEVVPHGFLVKLMLTFKSEGFQQVGLVFEDKLVPAAKGTP
ncbi:MAG: biopolymer transporter ExbD [SAR324 cluster bacterium]|nr:biopolymer transporter ExbD [SAR324 cluster bacterium]